MHSRKSNLLTAKRAIEWWLDNHGKAPTAVGAIIQRNTAVLVNGYHRTGERSDIPLCMDDLLNLVKGELESGDDFFLDMGPGSVIEWKVPAPVPFPTFWITPLSRKEELEAMSDDELEKVYQGYLNRLQRKGKIHFILEEEK